jgi:hypothetical protein
MVDRMPSAGRAGGKHLIRQKFATRATQYGGYE